MLVRLMFCCALVLLLAGECGWSETRRALLIGINTYQPPQTTAQHPQGCTGGRCDLPQFDNLDGAVNDVAAMRDLLVSPKFGFAPGSVVVLTNPALPASQLSYVTLGAKQTTHDGLLAAMQKYLVDVPQKGDTVVFYYAGHGSLRLNTRGTKMTLMVDGKQVHADSTLVPADAWTGGYDVRDREMTRIFNAALDKGVKLTVIMDSCHSGAFTRGVPLGPKVRERMLPYDPRDINEAPDASTNGQQVKAPAERADNPALIFSAAQQDQTAKESPTTQSVPEAHGAFTAALIKALAELPADAPASVMEQQVRAVLEAEGIEDQSPALDATQERRQQPLFGGASNKDAKLRAAVVAVGDDGITLDSGRLANVGPGSTFVTYGEQDKSKQVTLKVGLLQGIARSKATVVSPAGARVTPGQVFELDKWVPVPSDPLHFWTWPAGLSQSAVNAAADQVRAAGVATVSDPAEEPWTHLVAWDGAYWTLQRAGDAKSTPLGATLTAAALKQNVPSNARLWVNLPPPQELAAKLDLHTENSMVQGVTNVANADYVLAGSLSATGPTWAWYHKTEFVKGPPDPNAPKHSPGCSGTSNYPVRTDWVAIADAAGLAEATDKLNEYASRLAKLAGWLRLPASPDSSGDEFYRLAFQRVDDSNPLSQGQAVKQGEKIKLLLTSSSRVLEKRWVYVLDIDCRGNGNLVYPLHYSENRFPNDATDQRTIALPGGPTLKVGEPFGLDTILLISTDEPLADPYSLNFKGVSTRGARQASSPLEQLLSNTSSGTRGFDLEPVPTSWSVSVSGLQSQPASAP